METLKRMPLRTDWPVLLSNFFNRDAFNEGNQQFFNQNNAVTPAVNIQESEKGYVLEMLAPGLSKTDFRIELDGDQLTVSAEKSSESQEGGAPKNYHRKEFRYQAIRRTFTLPENMVDADKITARYADGILHLDIPKKEEALPRPAKLIEIS